MPQTPKSAFKPLKNPEKALFEMQGVQAPMQQSKFYLYLPNRRKKVVDLIEYLSKSEKTHLKIKQNINFLDKLSSK